MDKDALYWLLSTLPQVSVALVAFVGFLALFSLEKTLSRRNEIEKLTRRDISEKLSSYPFRAGDRIHQIGFHTLDTEPGDSLMSAVECFFQSSGDKLPLLQTYYDTWKKLDLLIKSMYKALVVFVSFNLFVIGGCLTSLVFVPNLVMLPHLQSVFVAIGILMTVLAGFMIFLSLYRPRI